MPHAAQGIGGQTVVYSTISTAIAALKSGDHIVITAGTYRETLRFPMRAGLYD
ncbi:hypothetical protein LMG28614_07237 [Paraburkholderia ultramafica]|uniref:DUF1565 domain-containing protein n=2 Tax=Paraburkholderia ultramafica TaxID=1544867 RepID=A0A6S7BR27_9BURK|nr:hypothetical protein LMG28614_07237 [Paraburkholderia ultramafica]